jgi:hypothetical protein
MKALWCGAAALIDEAGPTASHGGSFVHQGQSHPGEHSPIIDFAATTRLTAPTYWGVRIHLLTASQSARKQLVTWPNQI